MTRGLTAREAAGREANPDAASKRAASRAVHERLRRGLEEARAQTDALFDLVHARSLYARPIPERNRIVFYLGHLEAFDWNLLCRDGLGLHSFDPQLDRIFAFGIDPLDGTRLPKDAATDWPALATIRRYGQRVRAALDAALGACAFGGGCPTPMREMRALSILRSSIA